MRNVRTHNLQSRIFAEIAVIVDLHCDGGKKIQVDMTYRVLTMYGVLGKSFRSIGANEKSRRRFTQLTSVECAASGVHLTIRL